MTGNTAWALLSRPLITEDISRWKHTEATEEKEERALGTNRLNFSENALASMWGGVGWGEREKGTEQR